MRIIQSSMVYGDIRERKPIGTDRSRGGLFVRPDGTLADIRSGRPNGRNSDGGKAAVVASARDAMGAEARADHLADTALLSRYAERDREALIRARAASGSLRKSPRDPSIARVEQSYVPDRAAKNAMSAALAREAIESQDQEGRPRRATRYPSWEEQHRAGLADDSTGVVSIGAIPAEKEIPTDMSFSSKLLVGVIGGLDDVLDFVTGWFPGIASLVSAGLDVGQIIVIILDTGSKRMPVKEKGILLGKRIGIVVAIWVIEGIPVVNLLPLQSFLVIFLLSRLKKKLKHPS